MLRKLTFEALTKIDANHAIVLVLKAGINKSNKVFNVWVAKHVIK